ncbi:hypothetical protein ACQ86B_14610 [Mycolicibacterium aichiense]|uniref:hypothetical protein n=1 Tax=Mycolicibacterium aichiense TaxID=1799 RepID=UPI003D665414
MSAAVGVELVDGVIASVAIALGGVAPRPWRVPAAEAGLVGLRPEDAALRRAGEQAMAGARPLSQNAFKVPLGRSAVHRALVRALGTGGGRPTRVGARLRATIQSVSVCCATMAPWPTRYCCEGQISATC